MSFGQKSSKAADFMIGGLWMKFAIWSILMNILNTKFHEKSRLISITNENWQRVLFKHPTLLVLFHSSHCTASAKLKNELRDFTKLLHFQNSKVEVAELDVFHFEPIMRQMGFPDFATGKTAVPFVGFYFDSKPHLLSKKNPQVTCE